MALNVSLAEMVLLRTLVYTSTTHCDPAESEKLPPSPPPAIPSCVRECFASSRDPTPHRVRQTGWGVTLPWLSYVEGASDVRDGTDIEMQLTFESDMKLVLAKYSLDGTWLGMEEMSTQASACVCGARIEQANFFSRWGMASGLGGDGGRGRP